MRAFDVTITAPNTAGSLAKLAEELGREAINIEGLCAVELDNQFVLHVLTTDRQGTARVVNKVGYAVAKESEVVVQRVEDRLGVLGEITRRVADAGINLTAAYLATNTRLVLGCDDLDALEGLWQQTPINATR